MDGPDSGYFFDGRTAGRRPVRIERGGARLRILSAADGAMLAEWPYDRLHVLSDPRQGEQGLIGCDVDEDARLTVTDPATFAWLAGHARHRHLAAARRHWRGIAAGVVLAIAAAATLWFAWSPVLDAVARAIPVAWEAQLGRAALQELLPKDQICTGAAGQAALNRLTERLARPLGGAFTFHVRVMRSKGVNAYALPGGEIVILHGLIDKADSMDEVAGVLAHEMAHVVERHATRLILRHYGLSLLAGLLIGDSRVADAVSSVGALVYSREFEAEADARGLDLLKSAGLRSGGLATFFARLDKQRGDPGVLRYLTSHPPPAERSELARRSAGGGMAPMSDAEWKSLRAICRQD